MPTFQKDFSTPVEQPGVGVNDAQVLPFRENRAEVCPRRERKASTSRTSVNPSKLAIESNIRLLPLPVSCIGRQQKFAGVSLPPGIRQDKLFHFSMTPLSAFSSFGIKVGKLSVFSSVRRKES